MSALSLLAWLSWCLQCASLAGLPTRLLFLFLISLGNVCVGGALYRMASGQPWGAALFKSYGLLFRVPGAAATNETSFLASLVLNMIFIFGLFVFATFLSMVSDEIKHQLHAIRAGDVRLPLSNHVVVLNWNQQSLSLLKQLSSAQSSPYNRLHKRPIVVLAPHDKPAMDAAVAALFKGSKQRIFCRSGRPTKTRDLEHVAAEAADTVVILQPEESSSRAAADALKATALVSLTCLRQRAATKAEANTLLFSGSWYFSDLLSCLTGAAPNSRLGTAAARAASLMQHRLRRMAQCLGLSSSWPSMRIVVQMLSSPTMDLPEDVITFLSAATASSLYTGRIQQVQLLSKSTLDRLVCQTAAEPGVATVFRELVRVGGDVRLEWCDVCEVLAGSYSRAAALLQDSILLGALSAETGQLLLNPPDQLMLSPGDRLVGLTRPGVTSMLPTALHTRQLRTTKRTLSRLSSMASPQLPDTKRSSSSGGRDVSSKQPSATAPTPGQKACGRCLRVIVLGFQQAAVPELLLQLQSLTPRGSSITVLLPATGAGEPCSEPTNKTSSSNSSSNRPSDENHTQQLTQAAGTEQQAASTVPGQSVHVIRTTDPAGVHALQHAGIAEADAVIIGPDLAAAGAAASTEADALVTAAMLAVQQVLQHTRNTRQALFNPPASRLAIPSSSSSSTSSSSRDDHEVKKLHVVAIVGSCSIRRALRTFLSCVLLECSFSYEIMVLDEFAASLLALVAEDLANSLLIEQLLLQPSANTLSMWSLERLGMDAEAAPTFDDISRAARQHRCTALGYRRADGRMVLVPSPRATTMTACDFAVVLVGGRKGHGPGVLAAGR